MEQYIWLILVRYFWYSLYSSTSFYGCNHQIRINFWNETNISDNSFMLPEINFSLCFVVWYFKVDCFFLLSIKYYGLVILLRNCFRLCIIYLVLWTLMQDYQDWKRGRGMCKLMMRVCVIPVMHALVRSYLQCILMTLSYVTRLVTRALLSIHASNRIFVSTFHVSPQSCYALVKCSILGHLIFIPMLK